MSEDAGERPHSDSLIPDPPVAGPQLNRKTNGQGYVMIRGIRRGMLFWASVTSQHALGSEHHHETETLYVIMSNDRIHQRLPIVFGVPLTSNTDADGGPDSPYRQHRIRVLKDHVKRYTGFKTLDYIDRLALTEHGRELAHERLRGHPVGSLSDIARGSVEAGLRYALHIP